MPSGVTIDWCEDNYKVSPHIAEFYNTLTAALTVIPALLWLRQENPPGTQIYRLLHLNLAILQIGSALFHGTLTWVGQLLDEVPILIWCCASVCLTFDTWTIVRGIQSKGDNRRSWDIAPVSATLKRVPFAPGPGILFMLGAAQVVATVYIYVAQAKFYETFLGVVLAQAGLHWPMILSELFGRLNSHKNFGYLKKLLILHVVLGYGGAMLWTVENMQCESDLVRLMPKSLQNWVDIQSFQVKHLRLHALWHILAIMSLKYWHDFLVLYRLSVLSLSIGEAQSKIGLDSEASEASKAKNTWEKTDKRPAVISWVSVKLDRSSLWGMGNIFSVDSGCSDAGSGTEGAGSCKKTQ